MVVMPLDAMHDESGEIDMDNTVYHVPNEWAIQVQDEKFGEKKRIIR